MILLGIEKTNNLILSLGCQAHSRKKQLVEKIPDKTFVLLAIWDCSYCRAKRFYREPPKFYCSSGEIHLVQSEMPGELVELYIGNNEEAKEFQECVRC